MAMLVLCWFFFAMTLKKTRLTTLDRFEANFARMFLRFC